MTECKFGRNAAKHFVRRVTKSTDMKEHDDNDDDDAEVNSGIVLGGIF